MILKKKVLFWRWLERIAKKEKTIFHIKNSGMAWIDEEDDRTHLVIINKEEQYSIWLAENMIPAGWEGIGFSGTKQECRARIEEIWVDMRPNSRL